MSRRTLRDRLSLSFLIAAVILLLPAMPLLSQNRVSWVKDPAACPFDGLVSCGTAFLSFSFRTGFHVIYATTSQTRKLGTYGLERFPGVLQPATTTLARQRAIAIDGYIRQPIDDTIQLCGLGQSGEFNIDLGCPTIFMATFAPPHGTSSVFGRQESVGLRYFIDTATETPRAMVRRYTTISEPIADRVDEAIKAWAEACHDGRAAAACTVALSSVVRTLRQVRRELAGEPYTYGASWMTRLGLRHENEELALAYGEMEQGFQCWAGKCNGDQRASMGPRAATAFEAGANRRVRVDVALGRLLIAGN
jgi:hypothetical protein